MVLEEGMGPALDVDTPFEFIDKLICWEIERIFRIKALQVRILMKALRNGFSLHAKTNGFILEFAMIRM